MIMNTEFTYTVSGERKAHAGFCKDLSHTGIKFLTERNLEKGTLIEILFDTKSSRFKPMKAGAEIVRSEFKNNKYVVAGKILEYK
ncbi:MAG: PilZ domain-containing protein [Nitrospirae bacterium]|nr:PilZ domain-containing protein [Nitrospirota bacterium]